MQSVESLRAVSAWNGEKGADLFRQSRFEKNNHKQTRMLKDASRHFSNHDRIEGEIFLLERSASEKRRASRRR